MSIKKNVKSTQSIKKEIKKLNEVCEIDVIKSFRIRGSAKTDGRGLWSREARNVTFTLEIPSSYGITVYPNDAQYLFADAEAYFPKKCWNTEKHGLIYTDELFLKGVRRTLKDSGIKNFKDIDYTEQGMQGSEYVSLGVGADLLAELIDTGKIKTSKNIFKGE